MPLIAIAPVGRRTAKLLVAAGLLALAPTLVLAYGNLSRAQLATLPEYCANSRLAGDYDANSDISRYWAARIGTAHNSIHHYCQGLFLLRSAKAFPFRSPEQQGRLKTAIGEFDYVLERSSIAFRRGTPLWPEMLLRRGEAAVLLENWALAAASYDEARIVKPDYWPAYLDWARQLDSLKLRQQARELIQQGLRIDPSVVPMREAFVRYGGKPQDLPVPAAPAASAPVASEAAPAASAPAASEAAPAASAAASE